MGLYSYKNSEIGSRDFLRVMRKFDGDPGE
jgi:hypothetical protein